VYKTGKLVIGNPKIQLYEAKQFALSITFLGAKPATNEKIGSTLYKQTRSITN
jgi:hypothetical protein